MSIDRYLNSYRNKSAITLVGPFGADDPANKEPVIFVDGGSRHRPPGMGISVGDGDSYEGELDVQLNPDKNFSDLAFALRHIPLNFTELHLKGFLGGRRDHELFNFGEAHHFLKSRTVATKLQFDDKVIAFSAGEWRFHRSGIFSIGVIEKTRIGIWGECRYPCSRPAEFKPLSSLGLSNIGTGTISMTCDRPAFVFFETPER